MRKEKAAEAVILSGFVELNDFAPVFYQVSISPATDFARIIVEKLLMA